MRADSGIKALVCFKIHHLRDAPAPTAAAKKKALVAEGLIVAV
jgi:hypothetical protein